MPGARWRGVVPAVALAVVLAGCGKAEPTSSEASPVALRAEDAGWVLDVRLPSTTLAAVNAIPLETTVTWNGADPQSTIWGSGSGVVTFAYMEIGGGGRSMGGVMNSDCRPHSFTRGVPVAVQPGKGWATTGEDPNIAFYRAWAADPVLHLPAGRWRIVVGAEGMLAPCDANAPKLKLSIPIELTIR
jgi:hypothetical protein